MSESNSTSTQAALEAATLVADAARSQIANARGSLDAARQAFDAASATFKGKPTPANATAKLVAEQLVLNAKEVLDGAQAEAAPTFRAESLAKSRHEFAIARATADSLHLEDIVNSVLKAEAALRDSIVALQGQLAAHNGAVRTVSQLGNDLGIQVDVRHIQVDDVRRQIGSKLQARYRTTPTIAPWVAYEGTP